MSTEFLCDVYPARNERVALRKSVILSGRSRGLVSSSSAQRKGDRRLELFPCRPTLGGVGSFLRADG